MNKDETIALMLEASAVGDEQGPDGFLAASDLDDDVVLGISGLWAEKAEENGNSAQAMLLTGFSIGWNMAVLKQAREELSDA